MTEKKIVLALDVSGGEAKSIEPINAARLFVKAHHDVSIILVGKKQEIDKILTKKDNFTVIDAPDVIHGTDSPLTFLRNKNTSLYKTVELVQNAHADGLLSNSSTAPFVVVTTSLLGLVDGIDKAAFMSYLPTTNRKGLMLLDEGANINYTATDLVNFAYMANCYCKEVRHINNPSISLLNIGTEDNKGYEQYITANKILKEDKSINYQGFIEGNHVIEGKSDIIVSDGYTGNILLKTLEGTLKSIAKLLKHEYKKPLNLLGGLLSLSVIKTIKKTFDYKNYAAAFVMGLKKVACKAHGNADCQEFYSALGMLYDAVKNNLPELITSNTSKKKKNVPTKN